MELVYIFSGYDVIIMEFETAFKALLAGQQRGFGPGQDLPQRPAGRAFRRRRPPGLAAEAGSHGAAHGVHAETCASVDPGEQSSLNHVNLLNK